MKSRLPIALLLLALVAGCDDNSDQPQNSAASGEVLKGTISDEMLPYDKLRSHPPLAETDGSGSASSTTPQAVSRSSATPPVDEMETTAVPEAVAEEEAE